MLWMLMTLTALAGDYTVDALLVLAQKGMSADTIATLARDVPPGAVAPEQVVPLLRAGMPKEAIAVLTNDEHPTEQELLEAAKPGLTYAPPPAPPREYRNIDDVAWLRLRGEDLVVRLADGSTVAGILMSVTPDRLIFRMPENTTWSTPRAEVSGTRRADGKPIVSTEMVGEVEGTEREVEWRRLGREDLAGRRDRMLRTGTALTTAGAVCSIAGLLGLVGYAAEYGAIVSDPENAYTHANGAIAWTGVAALGLGGGVPMIVAGAVVTGAAPE